MRKILILCAFAVFVQAHSLKGFIKQDGQNLVIKAYYYGNSPCIECEVQVFDDNGEILHTLKTDKNGILEFKNPNKNLKIEINGGLGHKKVLKFSSNTLNLTQPNLAQANLDKTNPNLAQNTQALDDFSSNLDENLSTQNVQNPNLTKFANFLQKDDFISNLIKFSISLLILFVFFGGIYALKRKKESK